ncbi:recombinase family protein [Catellatospora sp. NPDC049111]|uniref:recombinase family protein n=1 Tax=Catellatospora sp. NPDC049111 TaxID=3155271 RepID=UPI0034015630
MTDIAALLAIPGKSLDGITMSGDEARQQLGVELYPLAVRTMEGLHVAIYLRISDDRQEEYKGVRRQAIDTISWALARGAASITIYEENDTSAFKKKRIKVTDEHGNRYFVWRVIRPRWQAMLVDLRSGACKAACVYDLDRLTRDNRDLEDAIEIAEHYHRYFDGTTGSLDLNTDGGRAMARVITAMNNKSSADTSRRQKRKHRELAEEGIPVGSRRPFGWKADKLALDPVEAAEIRKAVDKLLAGVGVMSIVGDWNSRGLRTSQGNFWRRSVFVGMLRNPRIAGFRSTMARGNREAGEIAEYYQIVTRADGTEVKGTWEPIVKREVWEALVDKIGKSAQTAREGGRSGKYQLSGKVRCGRCPSLPKMAGAYAKQRQKPAWRYQCDGMEEGGCTNSRNMARVDDLIRDLVFLVHDKRAAEAVPAPASVPPEVEQRLADVDGLLADLYEQWKSKQLPSQEYFAMRKDLNAERDEMTAARAAVERREVRQNVSASVRDRWDSPETTMGEKQAFIGAYLEAVIIHPIEPEWSDKAGRMVKRKSFNPALIEPIWLD